MMRCICDSGVWLPVQRHDAMYMSNDLGVWLPAGVCCMLLQQTVHRSKAEEDSEADLGTTKCGLGTTQLG
jgi:hypothetical protein